MHKVHIDLLADGADLLEYRAKSAKGWGRRAFFKGMRRIFDDCRARVRSCVYALGPYLKFMELSLLQDYAIQGASPP
jgi:hypothetical protein